MKKQALIFLIVFFLAGCSLIKDRGKASFGLEIVYMPSLVSASLDSSEPVTAEIGIKNTADEDAPDANLAVAYIKGYTVKLSIPSIDFETEKTLTASLEVVPGETETLQVVLITVSELSLIRKKTEGVTVPLAATADLTIMAKDIFGRSYELNTSLAIELQ